MAQSLEGGLLVVTGHFEPRVWCIRRSTSRVHGRARDLHFPQAEEITTEAKKSVAIEYSHRLLVDDRVPWKRSLEPPLFVRRIARRLH